MFRGRVRQVHFVGIGGIGMSGLAEICRSLGFAVSGSDMHEGQMTRRLEKLGATISVGHREANIAGADVVVYSSAIPPTNPELQEARRAGIPAISRGELLAELMRLKYGVAIAGSHGKTTTTSLVATVLRAAALDPTVVVGGRMASLGSNAHLGGGDLLVAEADESDGSFLRLSPTIAVVTNIDPEHLDHYGDYETLRGAFLRFVEKVPFYGLAVLCLDHPAVQQMLPQVQRRHVTYGLSPQADYAGSHVEAAGLETHFRVSRRGEFLGDFSIRMPGQHNVLNALATIAVADELEVPLDLLREALATFSGVARRFTIVGEERGVPLVDDYGHHPAEVQATLRAARQACGGRVHVAFQPHRFTRTQLLFEEFTRAFNEADTLLLADIYPAGESPIAGIDSASLAQAVAAHGFHQVEYVANKGEIAAKLAARAEPGDIVIALGAGDINKVLAEVRQHLAARPAPVSTGGERG